MVAREEYRSCSCVCSCTAVGMNEVYLSIECDFLSAVFCEERVTRNLTGSYALDVWCESYRLNNEVLGQAKEHVLRCDTVNCHYANVVVISRSWLKFIEISAFSFLTNSVVVT